MAVAVAQEFTHTGFASTQFPTIAGAGIASTSVIVLAVVGLVDLSSISYSSGSYTADILTGSLGGNTTQLNVAVLTAGPGGSETFTLNLSADATVAVMGYELSGCGGTPLQASTPTSQTTGTAVNGATMTPSTSGCLVLSFAGTSSIITVEPASPWVGDDSLQYFAGTYRAGVASGTGYTPAWTQTSSGNASTYGLVFQPPTGGATNSGLLAFMRKRTSGLFEPKRELWRPGLVVA